MARSRVRVLFTSYSLHKLLWLVPVGFVVGFVEAVGDLLIGRPRRARAAIGSWYSNLFHVRQLRASRKRAQALRTVHDSELRELQVSSTARLGAFLAHHLHTDTRLRTIGDASRSAVDSVSDGMRTPAAIAFLGFLVMVVIGSRSLITGGVPGDRDVRALARRRRRVRQLRFRVALHRARIGVAGARGARRHRRVRAPCCSAPPDSRRR